MFTIVLAIHDSVARWRHWAQSENSIDFRHDHEAAERCTMAYAASELQWFLAKVLPALSVTVAETAPANTPYARLEIVADNDGGGFELVPEGCGTAVIGHGRNGLLNGVYELLRLQGWRWLEPGPYGEVRPENPTLDFLKTAKKCIPSFRCRMIDQYRESDDSVELLKYLSRNRINVVQYKPATGKFADKLGMLSRKGGHLLDTMMHPEAIFDDGRTLWEAHQEWFGLPKDGQRVRESAVELQPCFANAEFLEWLGRKLTAILLNDMREVDIIDLWGFDTMGKSCSCPACRALGNGSDQFLHMLGKVQDHLDAHLGRSVMLNTVAYEPTATMAPPTRPAPHNLVASGSFIIFYPIKRCYRHLLNDGECEVNQLYREALPGWRANVGGMNLWAGEYYNVSRFEDLALVFGKLIADEMAYYHRNGCEGATYMHNLSPNWGVRALTQLAHTQYAWEVETNYEQFFAEYLQAKYGIYAEPMRQVYDLIEAATRDISAWRNFGGKNALSQFMQWDGRKPEAELIVPHYPSTAAALAALRRATAAFDEAAALLRKLLKKEQWRDPASLPMPQNMPIVRTPRDLEKIRFFDRLEYRLADDLRGVVYGADSYALMAALLEYYEALRTGADDNAIWAQVEAFAAKMAEYFLPVTYEYPTPGVQVLDALTRTQLRMTIVRCRAYRKTLHV